MTATADPAQLATSLTNPMRRALRRRQEDMLVDRAVVTGHGMTMRALRRRGVLQDEPPIRRKPGQGVLTPFGRAVVAADPDLEITEPSP